MIWRKGQKGLKLNIKTSSRLLLASEVAKHGSSSDICENWVSLMCTHIDDRVFELDVQPVVRNGNDGFISTAKIFHPFPLKNWEWHLERHKKHFVWLYSKVNSAPQNIAPTAFSFYRCVWWQCLCVCQCLSVSEGEKEGMERAESGGTEWIICTAMRKGVESFDKQIDVWTRRSKQIWLNCGGS